MKVTTRHFFAKMLTEINNNNFHGIRLPEEEEGKGELSATEMTGKRVLDD